VLDGSDRLYLARYWRFEQDLAAALARRSTTWAPGVDRDRLAADLRRLFPAAPSGPDWQRVAAALAVLRNLTVISGGPGTGKTRTVAAILALLAGQSGGRAPRVGLAAPTGKAAARLAQSIRRVRAELPLDEAERAALPEEAATLHRLLGVVPGRSGFRHDAGNPLHLDALVVDEASMVDLPLMARTVAALPAHARLVLLGDRDQLASVEAGAVLADICGPASHPGYSADVAGALQQVTGFEVPTATQGPAAAVADALVVLRRSYRFGEASGIGALAARVNAGDAAGALELLASAGPRGSPCSPPGPGEVVAPAPADPERGASAPSESGRRPDLQFRPVLEAERATLVGREVVPHFRALFEASGPGAALTALGRFRVLCALREGPWGVGALNALIERGLERSGLVPRERPWYPGRPVMVTRNDYALGLFNGDVGVLWPDPEAGGQVRAFFEVPGGGLRRVPPARLPPHETVFAMTVHKSQGSELDEVLLVLPDRPSPVLTRELLYTAVTRARQRVQVWGNEAVLVAAVQARVRRASGLREALWGGA
jgi:exodeoxyribonuclease V alpha subunit